MTNGEVSKVIEKLLTKTNAASVAAGAYLALDRMKENALTPDLAALYGAQARIFLKAMSDAAGLEGDNIRAYLKKTESGRAALAAEANP